MDLKLFILTSYSVTKVALSRHCSDRCVIVAGDAPLVTALSIVEQTRGKGKILVVDPEKDVPQQVINALQDSKPPNFTDAGPALY